MHRSGISVPKPPRLVKLTNVVLGSLYLSLAVLVSPPLYAGQSDWAVSLLFGGVGLAAVVATLVFWRA